jgi:putative endonuclease
MIVALYHSRFRGDNVHGFFRPTIPRVTPISMPHSKTAGRASPQTSCFAKGIVAEKLAEHYLTDRGYVLLEHRYKTKFGELDLVMHQDNHLVFVEVKQRPNTTQGLYAITERQKKRLWNAGAYFLQNHGAEIDWLTIRFDLIIVLPHSTITHLTDILSQDMGVS